jgi:hypothetical protein
MKCKPTNSKTRGYESCGKESNYRKLGLCASCFYDWMQTDERGKVYNQKTFSKKVKKVTDKRKRELKRSLNVPGAMKLADTYFSRYIRLKYSKDGSCTCYTCGTIKDIKEVDNGHYMKREHKATRYHENNCRPQCKTCNGDTKHNGKQAEFRVNLSYEIGENKVVEIENLSRSIVKTSYLFYKNISDTYRKKVNELQKINKVKYW